MKFLSLSLIVLLIVVGCSTANKSSSRPDDEISPPKMAFWPINNQLTEDKDFDSINIFLERTAKENPDRNTIWWVNYQQASHFKKKDKKISCQKYSTLAIDPNFPLKRLAYLRASELCPPEHEVHASQADFNVDKFEPWLFSPVLDLAINKASLANDQMALVELNLRKSKMNLLKAEKITYAKEALRFAKKLKDTKKINELQARIYNLSPSQMPRPQAKDYLAIAADFRYLRDFEKSEKYYNKVLNSSKLSAADKVQALRGIRSIFKVTQNKTESVRATERLTDFVSNIYKKSKKTALDAKLYTDTQLLLARTYWTEGQTKNAKKTLDKIEKTLTGKFPLADVYWMRGRMEEEKQNFTGAAEMFRLALKESTDAQSFKDKIMWYLAWNEYKIRNYTVAIPLLEEIKSRSENNFERGRISFWLAKAYAASDKNSDAKEEYKNLIKDDPFSFYGLAAHRELNIPLPSKTAQKFTNQIGTTPIPITRHLREIVNENYFDWLIATNETDVARDYLDNIAANLRKKFNDDIDSWVSLFQLYARSQNYTAMFNRLSELDGSIRKTVLEENMRIIFPNPYRESVELSASRFGISTEFIYSIMRQESSFNAQARSQMDAFGLMQLLPEVAKSTANMNSIDYSNPDDLFKPHINIPLGSAHLRELSDKYSGEIILAIASYNASEKAIANWLATRFRGDTFEFIEDIPYDETRDYVKLVLRNLINYKILNSNDNELAFPEWILKISYEPTSTKPETESHSAIRSPASTNTKKR